MQRLLIYFIVNLLVVAAAAERESGPVETPTGMTITPTAAPGAVLQDLNPGHANAPDVRAGGPASLAVSPDGKWLAILAGGNNSFSDGNGQSPPELNTDYVFLFDLSGAAPKQVRVFPIHASFQGLAWAPSSVRLFVSGGVDDTVAEFVRLGSEFVAGRTFHLGHKSWNGPDPKVVAAFWGAAQCRACAGEVAGLAVSQDGSKLLVANVVNDSASLIDIVSGRVLAEQDLRPGLIDPRLHGKPGGTYPRAVVWASPSQAYVASERDREVIALGVSGGSLWVTGRIPVGGRPVALVSNRKGSRLYAALDTTSRVAILDTRHDKTIETVDVVAPKDVYENVKVLGGANTNALVLTPDQRTLLVSNGGENALAVVALGEAARDAAGGPGASRRGDDDDEPRADQSRVVGLVPTGWYPSGVGLSKDGRTWYVVNGKTPTGPNVNWCERTDPATKLCLPDASIKYTRLNAFLLIAVNQQLSQLQKASLLSFHAPTALELAQLTKQVTHNDGLDRPDKTAVDERLFAFLHNHIKHVIYIMKENRSYDQILGDLDEGNGDPRFTLFPERITPNHHALARNFVDLDNTLVSGDDSSLGFTWTYAAQTTDYHERNDPRSLPPRNLIVGDYYGLDRIMNMGYATSKQRYAEDPHSPLDPDILPGARDVNAPDGPGGADGKGYLWDVALQKGLTLRNWGLAPSIPSVSVLPTHDPHALGKRVFWTTKASLRPFSDPYYYTLRLGFPDYWRVQEWKREFAAFSAANSAPQLMLMWLGEDHTGNFDKAMDGVNTPETQVADNDYALGQIVEMVANSPFAKDTLIVSIEDDTWDGFDHVDSHRTVTLFVGPYVRQHAVVSTRYTTVSVVKTIEAILGIGPIGLNDALAEPMSEVFDPGQTTWSYKAIVPDVLRSTQLPLPPDAHAKIAYPKHSAAYWAKAMADQDFSGPDRLTSTFSHELWRGLKGNTPHPALNLSPHKTDGDDAK